MVKFNEDEDLGKVVAKKQLFSFGAAPLTEFKEIVFAAGGNKFSSLCGFRFTSKAETDYKEFFVAFVCKLRSKIYHQAATNPSQWYIFKKISGKEMHCLAKSELKTQYGFDINKFFDSDYFQQSLVKFKKVIDRGLKTYVPDYVKKHGMEKAKNLLTSYDGLDENALVKDAIGRYSKAIEESLAYLDDKACNDKFYKLIDYDVYVESDIVAEASKWECEIEEKDGKFEVYEKLDHIWAATFADRAAAESFAKSYPKMKEEYLKQAHEAETKKEMVEGELTESDGNYTIAAELKGHVVADLYPNHFYKYETVESLLGSSEIYDLFSDYARAQFGDKMVLGVRAIDTSKPISGGKWLGALPQSKQDEFEQNFDEDRFKEAQQNIVQFMKSSEWKRRTGNDYTSNLESDEASEKELDDKIEEALSKIYN